MWSAAKGCRKFRKNPGFCVAVASLGSRRFRKGLQNVAGRGSGFQKAPVAGGFRGSGIHSAITPGLHSDGFPWVSRRWSGEPGSKKIKLNSVGRREAW